MSVKKAVLNVNPEADNAAFNTRFNKAISTMLEKNVLARPKGTYLQEIMSIEQLI